MSDCEDTGELLSSMAQARERFLDLVAEIRPELHRYCARMTGNRFDGEDVVQDTLAKAHFALSQMAEPPPLRFWLFRIAHNTAMDFLRRYERTHVDLVAEVPQVADAVDAGPDPALVEAALAAFVVLPPVQRSALVLKDVLGHSLEETAATMGATITAVKAALSRARANIAAAAPATPPLPPGELDRLRRYADLFNAHDWDGLRALLGDEARLDVVSRTQRRGREAGSYYAKYAEIAPAEGLWVEVGLVDRLPVIACFRPGSTRPAYFVRLEWDAGRITNIRDFRYVPYIAEGAGYRRG